MSGSQSNGSKPVRVALRSSLDTEEKPDAIGEAARARIEERFRAMGIVKPTVTGFETWDLVVGIAPQPDGRMLGIEGQFDNWPRHVQDRIMEALVRDCKCRPGHHVRIIMSGCFQDVPWEPAFLRVTVQEFPDFKLN